MNHLEAWRYIPFHWLFSLDGEYGKVSQGRITQVWVTSICHASGQGDLDQQVNNTGLWESDPKFVLKLFVKQNFYFPLDFTWKHISLELPRDPMRGSLLRTEQHRDGRWTEPRDGHNSSLPRAVHTLDQSEYEDDFSLLFIVCSLKPFCLVHQILSHMLLSLRLFLKRILSYFLRQLAY